jgi:cell division control protein 6
MVLNSIILLFEEKKGMPFFTGDVYNNYQRFCNVYKIEPLTQRRVGDIIQEFDMLGIINVRVVSKGRGGRMREIKLSLPENVLGRAKEIIAGTLNYS